jgi:hypothetical protein
MIRNACRIVLNKGSQWPQAALRSIDPALADR